jgi:hypothetical protein
MRALALIAALGIAVAGCGKTLTCKPGTILVTVHLDSSIADADQLDVTITVGSGASPTTVDKTIPHQPGATSGTLEVDFSKYPSGSTVKISVTALRAGAPVGSASGSVVLDAGCGSIKLSVGVGSSDGGNDLSASVDDLAMPDLAGADASPTPDLSTADLTQVDLAETPDLFQGTFCDGGGECTSTFCATTPEGSHVCCDSLCTSPCVGAAQCRGGTCSVAPAGAPGSPACGNYVCDGVKKACPTTCTDNSTCSGGHCCNGANCGTIGSDTNCGAGCTNCTLNGNGSIHCIGGTSCGCSGNADCGSDKYCDGATHTCQVCGITTACGNSCQDCTGNSNGMACLGTAPNQQCGCNTDADCPGGTRYCGNANRCVALRLPGNTCNPGDCAPTNPGCAECPQTTGPSPSPCPTSGVSANMCPLCWTDADCGPSSYCGKKSGSKVQCNPQLTTGGLCNENNCMVPGCLECAGPPPSPCPGSTC